MNRSLILIVASFIAQLSSAQVGPLVSQSSSLAERVTGLVMSPARNGGVYPYTGAVIRHPKLVYTCAHALFEEGIDGGMWMKPAYFYARHNQSALPPFSVSNETRGYYYYREYGENTQRFSAASLEAYSYDAAILFDYRDLAKGEFAPAIVDGSEALTSMIPKFSLGYPSEFIAPANQYLLHQVGPFADAFAMQTDTYAELDGVYSFGGHSGGPVFVDVNGSPYAAGIFVASASPERGFSFYLSGVHVITGALDTLVSRALSAIGMVTESALIISGNRRSILTGSRTASRETGSHFGTLGGRTKEIVRSFVVSNRSKSPVTLGGISFGRSTVFQAQQFRRTTLRPGAKLTLRVRFKSTKRGTHRALMTLTSSDTITPRYTFVVEGRRV